MISENSLKKIGNYALLISFASFLTIGSFVVKKTFFTIEPEKLELVENKTSTNNPFLDKPHLDSERKSEVPSISSVSQVENQTLPAVTTLNCLNISNVNSEQKKQLEDMVFANKTTLAGGRYTPQTIPQNAVYVAEFVHNDSSTVSKDNLSKLSSFSKAYLPKATNLKYSISDAQNVYIENIYTKNAQGLSSLLAQLNKYNLKIGVDGKWVSKQQMKNFYSFKFENLNDKQLSFMEQYTNSNNLKTEKCN